LIILVGGIELVAPVISTGVGSVLHPVTHTNPAKLISATRASHVIAPLVLLDARRAFGARFRVGQNPIGRFGFVPALLVPTREIFARDGSVGFFAALETKAGEAFVAAGDAAGVGEDPPGPGGNGDLLATRPRAPAGHAVCFHKRSELVTFELGKEVRGGPGDLFLGDELIAPRLRARLANAERSLVQCIVNVSIPAGFAKFVTARHANHFLRVEPIVIHANFAVSAPRRRPTGAIRRRLGHLFVPSVPVRVAPAAVAAGVDAAFLLNFLRVVEKGLEEPFLGPFVLAHENLGGAGGDSEDFRDFPDLGVHYGFEFVRGEHSDSGFVWMGGRRSWHGGQKMMIFL